MEEQRRADEDSAETTETSSLDRSQGVSCKLRAGQYDLLNLIRLSAPPLCAATSCADPRVAAKVEKETDLTVPVPPPPALPSGLSSTLTQHAKHLYSMVVKPNRSG